MFNSKVELQWQVLAADYNGNPDHLNDLKRLLIACKASSIKKIDDSCSTTFHATIPGWTTAWNRNTVDQPTYEDDMGVEYDYPDDPDVGSRIKATIERYGNQWSTIMVIELNI